MVVKVTIGDIEAAAPQLRERIVPAVKGAPGFVAGYWTRSDDGTNGVSMIVFDSESQACAAAE